MVIFTYQIENMTENRHIVEPTKAFDFMIAGKAKFTLVGNDNRFTYLIMQPKFDKVPSENLRFVKVMDCKRANDMTYIGLLKRGSDGKWSYSFRFPTTIVNAMKANPDFKPTLSADSLEVKALDYAVKVYQHAEKRLTTTLEMWHEGLCACCGRPLTVPEAISIGWGYRCLQKLKKKEASETQKEFEAR